MVSSVLSMLQICFDFFLSIPLYYPEFLIWSYYFCHKTLFDFLIFFSSNYLDYLIQTCFLFLFFDCSVSTTAKLFNLSEIALLGLA